MGEHMDMSGSEVKDIALLSFSSQIYAVGEEKNHCGWYRPC